MFKNIKYKVIDFLDISLSEARGLLILMILTFFFILFPYFYKNYFYNKKKIVVKDKALNSILNNKFRAEYKNTILRNVKFNINKIDCDKLYQKTKIKLFLCKRIVSYRKLLGGYYNINQLDEVYGLNNSQLKFLKKVSFIKKNFNPKKINIKKCSFRDLIRHPYINYKQAKLIKQNKNLNSLNEILNKSYSNKKLMLRIKNYLIN